MMFILLMMINYCTSQISESLIEKLNGYKGEPLAFTDNEMKELLYNNYEDVFTLFYYPQL